MLSDAVEVYRSTRFKDCEERAFMLTAVGVPSELTHEPGGYVALWVDASTEEQARAHLTRYQLENRPQPPPPPPRPWHPHAWVGSAAYAAVLLLIAAAMSAGLGRLDAFEVGELNAERLQGGEWWRAWTALTLHLDLAHLGANLAAGMWFGWVAGRLLGSGVAWLLTILAAAAANLLEGLLSPPGYRSVGASTAVFAALGLIAAYSWRERYSLPQRWALRWAPLVAGVVLLGWTGTAGEHTDVFAHLAGFGLGALLGVVAALAPTRRALARLPQVLAGALALGSLLLAWSLALHS
jgi:membrane associated rhomboid family serine protease